MEVRILVVYAMYVAPPTKSMSWMAAKMLEQEQQPAFQWKRTKGKACLEIVTFVAHKIEESDWMWFSMQLPCLPNCNYGNGSVSWTVSVSYMADFFEPYLNKYSFLEFCSILVSMN